jgi:hypothetical protein
VLPHGDAAIPTARKQSVHFVEKRTFAAAEPLLPLPPLGYDAFDESAARGGCDDCNQLAMAVRRRGRFLRQATAGDGALTLDGDVGLDALDDSHVEVTEVLHLVLDFAAGVALALTILLADALRLALFAHLRLAVQLCERRLLFSSQG